MIDDAAAARLVESAQPALPVEDSATAAPDAVRWGIGWGDVVLVLAVVWGTGSVGVAAVLLRRLWLFSLLFRGATPAPAEVRRKVHAVAAGLGLKRCPPVRLPQWRCTPMLIGCGRRTWLLFPRDLWDSLDDPGRDALLAHEMAHFDRGDQWVRLLELVCAVLFWWHPAVWAARRAIGLAEEECCDAWVVRRLGHAPRVYAGALLSAIDFISESAPRPGQTLPALPPVGSGVGVRPVIERRLTQIMRRSVAPSLPRGLRWAVIVACAVALPLAPSLAWRGEHSAAASVTTRPLPALPTDSAGPGGRAGLTATALPKSPLPGQPVQGWWNDVPAEQWSVVGSRGGEYRLRALSGRRVFLERADGQTIDLTADRIACVAFTPDGSRFVTGSADGHVRLWDAAAGEAVSTLGWHQAGVDSVAVSPDGRTAVSGARDGTVMAWNLSDTRIIKTYTEPDQPVVSVRFSPDGRTLAVAAGDWRDAATFRITLLDTAGWEPRRSWPTDRVAAVEFTADGAPVTTDPSGQVRQWDESTGESVFVGSVPKSVAAAAYFSPDHRVLGPMD